MYYIGIDLGGTKIAAGVVYGKYRLLSYIEHPTEAFSSRSKILTNIEKAAKTAVKEAGINQSDVSFTGLAIPACPEENGEVLPKCPNLPKLGRVRIRSILMKRLRCKVALENDAKCFILGEWLAGIAQKKMNAVGVTLGTGVGVGVLLNGQLYRGSHWCSGEIWDQPMPSGGIIEDGISGRNLAEDAGVVSGIEVIQIARKGNQKARGLLASYGHNVGWLISFLGRLLDPELFVLGGSMAGAFDLFGEEINTIVKGRWEIRVSEMGHKASIIGAAMLLQHPYPLALDDVDTIFMRIAGEKHGG